MPSSSSHGCGHTEASAWERPLSQGHLMTTPGGTQRLPRRRRSHGTLQNGTSPSILPSNGHVERS
eukprot:2217736-Prorocentrum_lima.AAC.1